MTKKHYRISQQDLPSVIANAITTETQRIETIANSQIDGVAGGAIAVSVIGSAVGGAVGNAKDLTTAGLVDRKLTEMSFD